MIGGIDLPRPVNLDCARLAFFRRQLAERLEPLVYHRAHDVRVLMIAIDQKLAGSGEDVDALARRAALALAGTLIGDRAEELALVVLAAALVPVVAGDGDELFARQLDQRRVGKG